MARKGAYDVREVARKLDVEVAIFGSQLEGDDFWDGVRVHSVQNRPALWDGVRAVVQPALVEDQPRALLHAIARGIPVIATEQCGVAGVRLVEFGDAAALESAIRALF